MSEEHVHTFGPWEKVGGALAGWERFCRYSWCPNKQFTTADPESDNPVDRALNEMVGILPRSREITWVEIAGRQIAAHKLVCEQCALLDLNVDVDTTGDAWVATCTHGHRWEFYPEDSLA